ncbi:PIN domain-containing protein [Mucilaginibacter sp. HD30]
MNGEKVILDTNILLYFLNGDKNVVRFVQDFDPLISFISELELLSAPEMSFEQKSLIQDFLSDVTIVKYDDSHKKDIVKVRAGKRLKLQDAIIASLAITLKLPLITADKALRNVAGLDLIFYDVTADE